MAVEKKFCLMGLIGLPGAGKTTFCRAYAQHLARKNAAVSLVIVSLDELISVEEQACAAAHPRTFKRWREQIAAAVDGCIRRVAEKTDIMAVCEDGKIVQPVNVDKCENNDSIQQAVAVDRICGESTGTSTFLEDNEFLDKICWDSSATHDRVLIVIDDNNYLRSMRYPYHQIARRRSCGFCQLHLAADVTTALKLNTRRESRLRVEETVIRTMAAKLEPPDPLANHWERFSFSIPVSEGAEVNFGKFFLVGTSVAEPVHF